MAITRDGERLGQTTWRAVVCFDNGEEVWARTVGEYEAGEGSRAEAEQWVRDILGAQTNPPGGGRYWGHVQRGHYEDSSFEAPEFGESVTDAAWEPDEESGAYVGTYFWLSDSGTVEEGEL